jgi:hypothetical protein
MCAAILLKGTVSQDLLLQVFFIFFHESSFSKPLKIRLGSFQTFSKNSSQGNLQVKVHHWYQRHRWQICIGINNIGGKFAEEGAPQISSANPQI